MRKFYAAIHAFGAIVLFRKRQEELRLLPAMLTLALGIAHAAPLSLACGTAVSPPGVAPNPGGDVVVTNSTTMSVTCVDTPVTQRIDHYSTTLTAILNGNQVVFQQTYPVQFGDPAVQAAISQADAILTADRANFKSPAPISSSTTLQSSLLSLVQSIPPFDQPVCTQSAGGLIGTCTETSPSGTVTQTTSSTDTFGPATVMTGENRSASFIVLAGQLDINVNVDTSYILNRTALTTNTYLTTQSFEIDGATGPVSGVPEPASSALLLTGAAGMMFLGWKKQRSHP